jgi:hypothetical protein
VLEEAQHGCCHLDVCFPTRHVDEVSCVPWCVGARGKDG